MLSTPNAKKNRLPGRPLGQANLCTDSHVLAADPFRPNYPLILNGFSNLTELVQRLDPATGIESSLPLAQPSSFDQTSEQARAARR